MEYLILGGALDRSPRMGKPRSMINFLAVLMLALLTGCSITPDKQKPLATVNHVDLSRFMGPWYVIGTIPWFVERGNVGTMDVYTLRPDGKIGITYVFRKKELSAERQEMHAVGTVVDKQSNATWAVRFVWPFQAPYLITDLAPDYRYTVVGHPSRDLVWIMGRKPTLPEDDYREILSRLATQGYDTKRIVRVPQARE